MLNDIFSCLESCWILMTSMTYPNEDALKLCLAFIFYYGRPGGKKSRAERANWTMSLYTKKNPSLYSNIWQNVQGRLASSQPLYSLIALQFTLNPKESDNAIRLSTPLPILTTSTLDYKAERIEKRSGYVGKKKLINTAKISGSHQTKT